MQGLNQIIIKGMSCPGCVKVIEETISQFSGKIIDIDLEKALAIIIGPLPDTIIEKICMLGYELQFSDGTIRKMNIKNPQCEKSSLRSRMLGFILNFPTTGWISR
jgi:copper chaperone CopZ